MKLHLPAILALLLTGCQAPEDLSMQTAKAVMAADRAFAAMSETTDVATAFRAYLAPDAIQLPNGAPVRDRADIENWLRSVDYRMSWEPRRGWGSASGEMGVTWGEWTVRGVSEAGDPWVLHGKYMNLWRKNPDGEWKVVVDMGNSSPPPVSGD